MKKLALIAVASVVALSGAVSPAFASLSSSDGTVLHQKDLVQVAARGGGDKGGRNDGGRNNGGKGRDAKGHNKGGKIIWRVRDGKNKPFFLFRGRGDCRTETVRARDGSTHQAWVCN